MVNFKIKLEPINIRIAPYGFYSFSLDYYKAGEKASEISFDKKKNYPAYFLYSRSIELVIKSVLLMVSLKPCLKVFWRSF